MDRFEDSRLRIIDDFCVQLSMDSSQPGLTNIHVDVEPLVLRVSLRDILLVLQIVSKSSELSGKDQQDEKERKAGAAEQKAKELRQAGIKQRTASGRGPSTVAAGKTRAASKAGGGALSVRPQAQKGTHVPHDVAKKPATREELSATIDGIRVVLIGDLHELPILDLSINSFTATAEDWASSLKAEAAIEMYTNVYNFAKSAWEPLIEPWQVGLGVARDQETGLLSVDVASRKTFDVTITTATIALASKSFAFLTKDEDVLGKPRGIEAPYRIRNYTGFDIVVNSRNLSSEENIGLRLADGEEAPWSFEHWEKMRENLLAESHSANVAVQLEGSGFDPVKNIRLNRQGEFLYGLRPKAADQVLHRLLIDVKLGERQRQIRHAPEPPARGERDPDTGRAWRLRRSGRPSLEDREDFSRRGQTCAGRGRVLEELVVRPDSGFGYDWSSETLWWRDLLKRPTRTMMCKGEHGEPFYFQLNANYDRSNPMTK